MPKTPNSYMGQKTYDVVPSSRAKYVTRTSTDCLGMPQAFRGSTRSSNQDIPCTASSTMPSNTRAQAPGKGLAWPANFGKGVWEDKVCVAHLST